MSTVKKTIRSARIQYSKHELNEQLIDKNPIVQFENWLRDALEKKIHEPYAMVLASASKDGKPSARVLLLRDITSKGFVFYTNYNSRKGKEIAGNPYAAMTFFWHQLERQVRIEGKLVKVSAKESSDYFNSRPRESQLAAWASGQSEVIHSRNELDRQSMLLNKKYEGKPVPRPSHWGGYCLVPQEIEFWQGRPNRLHDRILFTRKKLTDKNWKMKRLAP